MLWKSHQMHTKIPLFLGFGEGQPFPFSVGNLRREGECASLLPQIWKYALIAGARPGSKWPADQLQSVLTKKRKKQKIFYNLGCIEAQVLTRLYAPKSIIIAHIVGATNYMPLEKI